MPARRACALLLSLVVSTSCFAPATTTRPCDDRLRCGDGEVCDPVRGVCGPAPADDAASWGDGGSGQADATTGDAAGGPGDAAPAGCPSGYVQLAGQAHTYRFVAVRQAWAAARATCQAEGTALAVPDDAAELASWFDLVPSTADRVWIGINDVETEGVYRTEQGAIAGYLPWRAGDPDGASQDCVFAFIKDPPGELGDSLCTAGEAALCECAAVSP